MKRTQSILSKAKTNNVESTSFNIYSLLLSILVVVLIVLFLSYKEKESGNITSSSIDADIIETKQDVPSSEERRRKIAEANKWMKEEMKRIYHNPLSKYPFSEQRHSVMHSGILFQEYAKLFQYPSSIIFESQFLKEVNRKIEMVVYLKQAHEDMTEAYEKSLKSKFIYHSNAIEGNLLTFEQTSQIVEIGEVYNVEILKVRDVIEVLNHDKAFSELFAQVFYNQTINFNIVKEFHTILMRDLMENGGKFRKHSVGITGRKTLLAHYLELSSLMDKFMEYINSSAFTSSHPISQACLIHYNFVKIHPFSDGNGRLARLLMNLMLLRWGLPLTIIRKEDAQIYFSLIEEHREKSTGVQQVRSPFCDFIAKTIDSSLDQYIAYFQQQSQMNH